ncbi:MAG: hypothetical protein LBF44_03635 [Holosporaceae bacterium]|nr:hypothetical protein [Holosporaceae bacterium]
MDASSKQLIFRGDRLTEILKQPQYSPMNVEEQVVSIYLGVNGYLDNLELQLVSRFEKYVLKRIREEEPGVFSDIKNSGEITDGVNESLKNLISKYLYDFKNEFAGN